MAHSKRASTKRTIPSAAVKSARTEKQPPPNRGEAFVIGPIGSEHAPLDSPERQIFEESLDVYEKVIDPACTRSGFRAVRADRVSRPGEITDQVFRAIHDTALVVADLTGANPNVMYELGLRHATGKPTVHLGEYERLPFDLAVIRTIQFVRTPAGLVDARKRLEASIATGIAEGFGELTASRILRGEGLTAAGTPTVAAREPEPPGFLEVLAEMEIAFPNMRVTLGEITRLIDQMGTENTLATSEMLEAERQGKGAVGKLLVAKRIAMSMTRLADQLEDLVAAFEQQMRDIDAGVSYLLGRIEQDPTLFGQARDLVANVASWAETVKNNATTTEDFARAIEALASAARDFRSPSRRLADALRRIQRASQPVTVWQRRLLSMERPA